MKYTYQPFINGYGFPEGRNVLYADSITELKGYLDMEKRQAERLGAAYESEDMPGGAQLRVWIGHLEDVTDVYPDFELVFGPRGGIHRTPC